jgi:hypothetical protein
MYLGNSSAYTSRSYLSSSLLSSILSGLAQTTTYLKPHCSSGNCTYPSFVTLGICSHCEDVTDRTIQTLEVAKRILGPTHILARVPSMTTHTNPRMVFRPGWIPVTTSGRIQRIRYIRGILSGIPKMIDIRRSSSSAMLQTYGPFNCWRPKQYLAYKVLLYNHMKSHRVQETNMWSEPPTSRVLKSTLQPLYSILRPTESAPPPGWSLPHEAWRSEPIGELLQCTRRLQGILVGRPVTLLWRGEWFETGQNAICSKLRGQVGDHQSAISNL